MPQSDKNDTLLNKIDAKKKFPLSRTTRIILFFFLVSIEYSINVSSGLLSSASKIIKDSLKMNDTDFGLFGCIHCVFRGTCILLSRSGKRRLRHRYHYVCGGRPALCHRRSKLLLKDEENPKRIKKNHRGRTPRWFFVCQS